MQIPGWLITLIITVAACVVIILVFRHINKKAEKRQAEAEAKAEQYKQQVSMLIIDKKKMKIKESGLPQQVIEQTPWYASLFKVPIVKAKVGPRIMIFIADNSIFPVIPVKKEVKATISGLYITDVRAIHGQLERPVKKRNFFQKLFNVKN